MGPLMDRLNLQAQEIARLQRELVEAQIQIDNADKANTELQQSILDVSTQLEAERAAHAETRREAQFSLTCQRERADSFARLARAVGGVGCTEWQPEVDIEIEERIKALRSRLAAATALLRESRAVMDTGQTREQWADLAARIDASLGKGEK